MDITANANPSELLKTCFGWSDFKAGQGKVIQRLIDGKSTLAVFPTGGGKSLCYQLPALTFDGLTVVVSPLIALMKDQIDQLLEKGIRAVRLDSSLTLEEYRDAMSAIRSGEARLLYVAPERFFNERFRSSLDGVKISLFAIDEAHCISQWGHNFRPDYLKLAIIAKQLNVERVLGLTATATPEVQKDICAAFEITADDVVCTQFFRPNLRLRSQVVNEADRLDLLIDKLKTETPGATIVYVTLQKTAETVAAAFSAAGLEARAYHAGMDSPSRHEIQEWFMNGASKIVVATIAFGMGIDKSDIRYVYHFNAPKSIESYAQEIGRAGRDGEFSNCEMLVVPSDKITLENFVYGDTPSEPSVRAFINEIAKQPSEFYVSQYKLGAACDIKSIVVKTLLTYLELDGYMESTAPRYDSYSFKPNVPSSELLANFSGERQQFAKQLLANATRAKTWFSLDISDTMNKLNCDRGRIVRALDYFGEMGWLELKVSGLVHGYRKLKPFPSPEQVAMSFICRINEREESEIARTNKVFELARATECQAGILSAHFGQTLDENCGECSYCKGAGPYEIDLPLAPELDLALIELVKERVSEHPTELNSSRAIARYLCGITSPALTKAKLTRDQTFGSCSRLPFGAIKSQLDVLGL